jgi:outer membrane receptor for ferrienterochelin and colicins
LSLKLIAILILCMGWTHALGQTAELAGRVHSGGAPVEFVNVSIRGTSYGQVTDANGQFSIGQLPRGNYELEVSFVGYKPLRRKVAIHQPKIHLEIELEEDIGLLEDIVISGTLKEVHKLQSAIPVEVYSPTLFRKNPVPSIFESLNLVNGVQPQVNCNVCNTGDIHINGLEGPYTMILIDGMPIVSSLSTVYGLSGIPNSLVKRIEVVKGPASTLYGSEAVAGLINIITKDPTTAPRFQVDGFGTSVGEFNTDVAAVFKVNKKTSMVGINHFIYEQLRDINDDNFTDVPQQKRVSVFNKWNLPLRHGKSSSVAWRYFYEDRWGGELQWTRQFRGSDIYYGESIYTNRWELIGSHPLSRTQDLSFDYSYNYHLQDSYYGTVKFKADQHVTFAQFRWSKMLGKHDLLIGVPFRYVYYDDNTPGTSEVAGSNTPSKTFLPGLFIQDEIKVSTRFTSLAGLRYDHHNIHGGIFTPRISFKFSPEENSVLRITVGNGYRVVNLFTEDHAALTGSREVIIKNELKPEQSWNLNLNYSRNITFSSGFLMVDGSLFYTHFTNKIVGDFLTDPDKIIYDNLNGYGVSKGISLNVDVQFLIGFKALVGATLMDVYNVDETLSEERIPQLFAPRFSGTLSVSWSPATSKWMVDLTGRFNGPMHLPVLPNDFRPDKSPMVPLMNFQLTRTLHSTNEKHQWEIYGGVKNLLNFIPEDPLMRPFDPFDRFVDVDNPNGYTFDTTYNYAPVQGLRGFIGVRFTIR